MIGPRGTRTGSPRTERGQTAQDFAVGIGLFILAVAFVFAFIPTVLAPFTGADASGDTAQADRIAATVLEDLETETPNEIDADDFYEDSGELYGNVSVRKFEDVNVTVREYYANETLKNASQGWRVGEIPRDGDVGKASRIVTTTDGECEPSCQLVVRVW